uniref:hypothetical protein n=1 Tax=Klebsiella pneumoniae TaxID=573 RepID=UPI00403F3C78
MSYKVDQVKALWLQLTDAEKKEFTTYLFNGEKKSLRERHCANQNLLDFIFRKQGRRLHHQIAL